MPGKVVQHFPLHLLDLGAVAPCHAREHLRTRGDAQLGEDAVKIGDPVLGRLELEVGGNHGTISTMPRRVMSRLTCQCARNSSIVSRIKLLVQSQNTLAPK